jgi:hypothetical protein
MKKSLLIVLFFSAFLTFVAKAEYDPNDCGVGQIPPPTWEKREIYAINIASVFGCVDTDCIIKVVLHKTAVVFPPKEPLEVVFQIESVEFINCELCDLDPYKAALYIATIAYKTELGLENVGDVSSSYHFLVSTCWSHSQVSKPYGTSDFYEACSSVCCKGKYVAENVNDNGQDYVDIRVQDLQSNYNEGDLCYGQQGCIFVDCESSLPDDFIISLPNSPNDISFEPPGFKRTTTNINQMEEVLIYPNPTKDFITLQINNEINGKIEIEIYDLIGNLIFSKNFYKNQQLQSFKLDLISQSKGVYNIKIKIDNKQFNKSFIINK